MDDPLLEATANYTEIDSSLRRLARGLVPDAHAADDAVQEAWVTSLERRHVPSLSKREWMRGVVRFKVLALLRRDRRRVRRELAVAREEGSNAGEDSILQRSVIEFLRTEVARLADPYRSVVERHFFDDMTLREIAEASGRPLGTVKTHLHRGLEHLRDKLDRRHGGDRKAWSLPLLAWLARGASFGATRGAGISPAVAMLVAAGVAVFVAALAVHVPALFDHDRGTEALAALVPIQRADATSGWDDERTPWDRLRAEHEPSKVNSGPTNSNPHAGAGAHWLNIRTVDRANLVIADARVVVGDSVGNELREIGAVNERGMLSFEVTLSEINFAASLVSDLAPRAAVRCSAPGYITSEVLLPELCVNEEREIVVVLEAPDRAVAARIVDENGSPIEAARLQVARPTRAHAPRTDGALVRDLPLKFETGVSGTCDLRGLPRTAVELTIHAPGFESARRNLGLETSDGRVHTFRLQRTGAALARAWDSEVPKGLESGSSQDEARDPDTDRTPSSLTGASGHGARDANEHLARSHFQARTSSETRADSDTAGSGESVCVSLQGNSGTSSHRPSAPMNGLHGLLSRSASGTTGGEQEDEGGGSTHGLTGGGEGGNDDSSQSGDDAGGDALGEEPGSLAMRFAFEADPTLELLTRAYVVQHVVGEQMVTVHQGLGFPRGWCELPQGHLRLTLWIGERASVVQEFELCTR